MIRYLCILIIYILSLCELHAQGNGFYEISRLPFTSNQYNEFAPAFYGNGLVFTTNRKTGFFISRLTEEGENLYNIFFAEKRESGRWRTPDFLSKSLRSNFHDGTVSFPPDGSRIFFTRNIPGSRNETSKLGIFMAEYSNGDWINITPFPYNSSNYNISHPGISDDGKTLYFASDMPGGYGGMDIYMSELQGYNWSAPVNLGEMINSPDDEVFPYIHQESGRLYFSSSHNTNGSLDIFYSTGNKSSWSRPVRLPEPLNSGADDFGFIADRDFRSGYFSSNREGTDNIYSFVSTFPFFTGCDSIREPVLSYVFYEERGEVDTATYYFEWDINGDKIRGQEAEYTFEDIGSYHIRLDVVDIITGEVAYNQASYHFTIPRIEQAHIKSPDTCYVNQQITLDASETWFRNLDIDEFYWELGDGTKTTGEIIYHTYTRPGIYEIILGVLSDPDSPFGLQKSCVYKRIVVLDNDPRVSGGQ